MSRGIWTETDPTLSAHRERLVETLRGYGRVAVAYSGGVDSTVVAQAAREALGDAEDDGCCHGKVLAHRARACQSPRRALANTGLSSVRPGLVPDMTQ